MYFLIGLFLWIFCFWVNKNGFIIPKIGGGCFGGGDAPQINLGPAPQLPTADELFGGALNFAQTNTPLAFGARETAVADIATPQSTTAFFEAFQPTSFEQALANQFFQNQIGDIERSIKHNFSLSGIESSPALASAIADQRRRLGVDIGTQLLNAAAQRAGASLEGRLNLDPNQILAPFVETGLMQSQKQAQLENDRQIAQAQANFQNQLMQQRKSQSFGGTLGTLLGGGLGFLAGGPAGASLGAGLGGGAASLITGGTPPIDFGTALLLNQFLPGVESGTPSTDSQNNVGLFGSAIGSLGEEDVQQAFNFV